MITLDKKSFKKAQPNSDNGEEGLKRVFTLLIGIVGGIIFFYLLMEHEASWDNSQYVYELFNLLILTALFICCVFAIFVGFDVNPSKWADLIYYIAMIIALLIVANKISIDRQNIILKHTDIKITKNTLEKKINIHISSCNKLEGRIKYYSRTECGWFYQAKEIIQKNDSDIEEWLILREKIHKLYDTARDNEADEHSNSPISKIESSKLNELMKLIVIMILNEKSQIQSKKQTADYKYIQIVNWPKIVLMALILKLMKTIYDIMHLSITKYYKGAKKIMANNIAKRE